MHVSLLPIAEKAEYFSFKNKNIKHFLQKHLPKSKQKSLILLSTVKNKVHTLFFNIGKHLRIM